MKHSLIKSILATSALAFLGAVPLASMAQVVKVDGSSTVFPITEGIAEDFVKITVFQLHFKFFVITVSQIATDALNQFFIVVIQQQLLGGLDF